MLSFKQMTKTIVGISFAALLAGSIISCGKKKGGGGTTATAPNCVDAACTVGQSYAAGVYFRTAVGQANYGNNQNILAKLAFFAKNSAGLNLNTNPVTYNNGQFDVTGTIRVADGRYYGVSSTATRTTAGFNISFDFGLGYGYQQPQYYDDYAYYVPCGYNSGNCNGGYQDPYYNDPYYNDCQRYGNCNNGNNNNYGSCTIPVGDYSVTTLQSGNWNGGSGYGYNRESFSNLRIRFVSGGTTVDATFSQGNLQNSYNNTSAQLRGTMVVNSVNGQNCNQRVTF